MAEREQRNVSIINDCGPSNGSCGYCGGRTGFSTHGMLAETLTVYDYQDLLDAGWRRSGKYLYKPDLSKMCCPTYTIRLNVNKFTPSKAQKKVVRRLERFLAGDGAAPNNSKFPTKKKRQSKDGDSTPQNPAAQSVQAAISEVIQLFADECDIQSVGCPPPPSVKPLNAKQLKLASEGTEFTSSCPFPLFAFLQKAKLAQGKLPPTPIALAEILATKFNDSSSCDYIAHAVKGHLNFSAKAGSSRVRAASEAGMSGASDVAENASVGPQGVGGDSDMEASIARHTLDIQLAPSSFVDEEYELYKKYQMAVHGDAPWDCSASQYKRFLVSSPLVFVSKKEDPSAPECGYGAFHAQYRVGGKLIAVGVVDILPKSLSSKYLFWDPDYAPWSLGKVSALKEIEWIQEACKVCPELKYYYMGYYIHSCPKMKYKGEYCPSELMCPVNYDWVTLTDAVRDQLDKTKYTILSELPDVAIEPNDSRKEEEEEGGELEINEQMVSLRSGCLAWGDLKGMVDVAVSVIESIEDNIRAWRLATGPKGVGIAYSV